MRDSEARSSPDDRPDDRRAGQPAAQGRQPGPRGDLGALLAQVARGDLAAFEAVYDGIGGQVFGLVRSVLRDPAQAEEVAQEVLLEVSRTASRFDSRRGRGSACVTTLAPRRAVDRVRSRQASAERELRASSPHISYDVVAGTVEPRLAAGGAR